MSTVMYRQSLRRATIATSKIVPRQQCNSQRFASTFTSRATKRARSAVVRWGLAGAAVYYYSTAAAFADEPRYATHPPNTETRTSEAYPTIDTIAEQRKAQARASPTSASNVAVQEPGVDSPEALEEEASQQGAFNEETGEINWDCPCLGGMADGPCGEQFKAAFSCFVFSKEEPKGVDCIEHFKTMQNCFREHPEIYGAELDPDEEDQTEAESEAGPAHAVQVAREQIDDKVEKTADAIAGDVVKVKDEVKAVQGAVNTEIHKSHAPVSTSSAGDDELVPKAWHDSRSDNDKPSK